jgi:purine nucleoside phosphorylase
VSNAARRAAAFGAHAAVVFGSGLAGLSQGAEVLAELSYEELGWPCTAVPGHANLLRLVSVPWPEAPGATGASPGATASLHSADAAAAAGPAARLRLALACGRPHAYEGWSEDELRRPVAALCAWGVRRILLTNSCGALRSTVWPGEIVACHTIVDLQSPPLGAAAQPPHLRLCEPDQAAAMAAAVAASPAGLGGVTPGTGAYVAVAGPQFETPAEVAWLAGYGDVVGMSAAPEARAAQAGSATCGLLGLVANRAAAVGSHEDVLAVGAALAGGLAAALPAAVLARWPELTVTATQGEPWTS